MVEKRKGNTILCVEDEADIRSFACKVLDLEGYYCLEAPTGREALQLLETETIDLVLLDLKLVDSDGWEILKKIKSNPGTRTISVIVCTASFGQPQKERARRMGAAGYMVKPLSANSLRNEVSRVLPLSNTARR